MRIAVAREQAPGEARVAMVPELVGRLRAAGYQVTVQAGAGAAALLADAAYEAAGAPGHRASLRRGGCRAERATARYVLPGATAIRCDHHLVLSLPGAADRCGAASGSEAHHVRHGICAAHLPCAIDGCPEFPGVGSWISRSNRRCQHAWASSFRSA